MDVYEYDYLDNSRLQETCNLLQPFVFKLPNEFTEPDIEELKSGHKNDSTCYFFLYDDFL